ncbi:hypothetical protein Tco_1293008 [Tanacetum coccineum]
MKVVSFTLPISKTPTSANVRIIRNLDETIFIAFIIRNYEISLRLNEFARILRVPCEVRDAIFNERPPNKRPKVKGKEVFPNPYQIVLSKMKTCFRKWETILSENAISFSGNKNHPNACLVYMLYCLANRKPFNLDYYMAKRMASVIKSDLVVLPYAMLLTRLYKHVLTIQPYLTTDLHYLMDHVMVPLKVGGLAAPRQRLIGPVRLFLKHWPELLLKPFTHIRDWKGKFFYIEDKIVLEESLELLYDDNKFDKKIFQRPPSLSSSKATYVSASSQLVILHCGKEMAFKNFVVEGNDKDLSFMTREPTGDFKIGSPSVSINNEPSAIRAELRVLTQTVGCEYGGFKGCSWPLKKLITPLRVTRQKALMVLTNVSKAKGEPSTPLDVFNEDSNLYGFPKAKELKECIDFHRLERERVKDKEYVKMEAKCNVALENLDKNPLVVDLREEAWTLKGHIVKVVIFYKRCFAFEEVPKLKEPFDLAKVSGYRSSSKKEMIQLVTKQPLTPLIRLKFFFPRSISHSSAHLQVRSLFLPSQFLSLSLNHLKSLLWKNEGRGVGVNLVQGWHAPLL